VTRNGKTVVIMQGICSKTIGEVKIWLYFSFTFKRYVDTNKSASERHFPRS
jgi:hypothetical protein